MNLDPGGIVGGLLCLGLVILIAFVTRREGGRRRPRGVPIYRRNPLYGRNHGRNLRRRADDSEWGTSDNSHDSGGGFSCGGGDGGGGGGD